MLATNEEQPTLHFLLYIKLQPTGEASLPILAIFVTRQDILLRLITLLCGREIGYSRTQISQLQLEFFMVSW